MERRYTVWSWVLLGAAALVSTGCESFEVGAPPPPTLSVASVYPSNGYTYNSVPGGLYTAEAKSNVAYASADAEVRDPVNTPYFDYVPQMSDGELYQPSFPVRIEFRTHRSGEYRSDFTLYGAFGATARRGATFSVDITGGAVINSGLAVPQAEPIDCPIVELDAPMLEPMCPPPPGPPPPPPGPRPAPYLQYRPLPDKSREPFFLVYNEPDGKLSRGDIEQRAQQWSPQTRAFLDEFYTEVYPDDYDGWLSQYAALAPGFVESGDVDARRRAAAQAFDMRSPKVDGSTWASEAEAMIARRGEAREATADRPAVVGPVPSVSLAKAGSSVEVGVYPNPAVSLVTVRAGSGAEHATVFDIVGREVRRIDLSVAGNGTWDLRDESGRRVSSGLYLVRIDRDGSRAVHRVTVL